MNDFAIEADEDGGLRPAPPLEDVELDEPDLLIDTVPPAPETNPADLTEEELLARQKPPQKRRGRPRKQPPPELSRETPLTGPFVPRVPGPPLPPPDRVVKMAAAASAADPSLDSDDKDSWSSDALQLWPTIVRWLARSGIGPEAITISVSRVPVGPIPGELLKMSQIPGSAVQGYGPYSAGDQLFRYLVDVHHSVGGTGGRVGCGPAKYTLGFHYSSGGSTIKTGYLTIASYAEIMASRERAATFEAHAAAEQSATLDGAPMPPPVRYAPARAAPGPAYAMPVLPSLAGSAPGADTKIHEELGYLRAVRDEYERAAREGRAPNPIAAPPITPSLEDEEKRVARIVQASLAAAGIRPATEEEKLAKLLAANNDALMKNIVALYGTPGAAPAAAAPPQAAATVTSTVASLKTLLEEFKTLGEARESFKEALGIEEPEERETPQQVIVEQKPQTFFDKAVGFMKAMPPGALPAVLAGLSTGLKGSPMGDLLERAAEAAKAAGAAAQIAEATNGRAGASWGRPPSAG